MAMAKVATQLDGNDTPSHQIPQTPAGGITVARVGKFKRRAPWGEEEVKPILEAHAAGHKEQ